MKVTPEALADVVVTTIKRAVDGPLVGGRIARLEADLAAARTEIELLKCRPLQKWAGTFVAGTRYSEASLVTHHGSLWVATEATTSTPGTPGNAWRLIVKNQKGHA